MADDPALFRQWFLLRKLSSSRGGLTVQDLARELRVVDRTIRRDLLLLARVGFPLSETIGPHGRKYWKIREGQAGEPPMTFNLTEIVGLYMGRSLLEPLAGTDFWDGAQSAFRKIKGHLGASAIAHIDRMAHSFHATTLGLANYSAKAELIDALMIAIEDRKVVVLTYQSERATEPVTYFDLQPLGIIYHRQSLYLVAYDPQHSAIRHYKLERCVDVDVTDLRFTRPVGFSLSDHLAHSFGVFVSDGQPTRVRVRFTPQAARYVSEKSWHPTQHLERERDGSVIAEFTLSDFTELKSWILSFGPRAAVLEPASLRAEIVSDLRGALAHYPEPSRRGTRTGPPT